MKKENNYDDNRVIVNMNVEGMPWYKPEANNNSNYYPKLNFRQTCSFIWGALKAGLLVALIYSILSILVILFILKIWLKV